MVTELSNSKINTILREIKSKDGSTNLMEHLKKMYTIKKLMNDDEKYNDLFEDISIHLKQKEKYIQDDENVKDLNFVIDQNEKNLLNPLMKAEGGENNELQPVTNINFVPDYVDIFNKLSYGGLSFSVKESILITNSLRNLASTLPGNVTFFGKIFGSEKDYYIAEATEIDPPADFNYDADMEKRKEDGINRNVFYVTNNLTEKWVELPDVKPSQIKLSRKIKYIFTGNLNRKIYANPTFNGEERHLLRCQIARIYHGAKLVPSINHYTIEDPESPFKQLVPAEKPKRLTNENLTSLDYWIHYPPGILNNGRISHIIDDPPEGVEPEDHKKKIIDADPFDKRMGPASNDKKIITGFSYCQKYSGITPWRIEKSYEDNIYINPYVKMLDETQPDFDPAEQKENKMNYSLVVIKSLRWQGAYNAYLNGESYFFYVGNGMKIEDNMFEGYNFKNFPTIPEDKPDKDTQPEPHEIPQEKPPEENKVEEPVPAATEEQNKEENS
jgi:hypothetical protein